MSAPWVSGAVWLDAGKDPLHERNLAGAERLDGGGNAGRGKGRAVVFTFPVTRWSVSLKSCKTLRPSARRICRILNTVNSRVTCGGMISDLQTRTTKKGDKFALLRLEDQAGGKPERELLAGSLSEALHAIAKRFAGGDYGRAPFLVKTIHRPSSWIRCRASTPPRASESSWCCARLLADYFPTLCDPILGLLSANPGDCDVTLEALTDNGTIVRVRANQALRVKRSNEAEEALKKLGCSVSVRVSRERERRTSLSRKEAQKSPGLFVSFCGSKGSIWQKAKTERPNPNQQPPAGETRTVIERMQLARYANRPYTLDSIQRLFEDFVELHGDKRFAEEPGIIAGRYPRLQWFAGGRCGPSKRTRHEAAQLPFFGYAETSGYRKALRVMKLGEKFGRPIFTFIHTPGAYPGIDAEERGQAEAIAFNLREMAKIRVPIIVTVRS